MGSGAAQSDKFAVEFELYRSKRDELIALGGEHKWIIALGSELRGPFDTVDAAWEDGVRAFGGTEFMVQRVTKTDAPAVVSHLFVRQGHDLGPSN